ncbi:MAG: choline-sulfatase [Chloroflexi bacterium]|nr:choline-sulfatase [Chloroflexota bacterium]
MPKPNILIIMSDEHAPMYSSVYGHPIVQTPNMERLAAAGATFDAAYCNSPLCMPSRMSFMTGRLVHHIGAWDNVAPLPSDEVTWAHRLRAQGYDVALSGKQHFGGPDQLHGFQRQLARDLHAEWYHAIHTWDDGITPAAQPWQEVYAAGPGATEELDVDDLAQQRALAYLRDPERQAKPWALNVSFIAPHFPLVAPQRFWDMYPPAEMDLPEIPAGHLDQLHPMAQRLRTMFGFPQFPDDVVRRARAGYYALISYLDEKIGELLDVLVETGQYENTVIIHISDHGDMNGEHGMWRKSNFYEASSRVPLQVAWPGRIAGGQRFAEVVSLVDVAATICDIAGDDCDLPLDGDSLLPLQTGRESDWKDEAFCEYLAHGSDRPMAMLRRGRYKLNYSWGEPVELYDLEADPGEFQDLASSAEHQDVVADMEARLLSDWDPAALDRQVRASQRRQRFIEDRFGTGWRASFSL